MTDTKSQPEAQVPEMVARIAGAISLSFREEGFVEGVSDPAEWAEFLRAAKQVVAAMVEPTADMVETGEAGIAANLGAANVWRGMMTAALDG